jgi:hypothetical protein
LGNSGGNSVAFADGLAVNWQERQPVGVFGLLAAKAGASQAVWGCFSMVFFA